MAALALASAAFVGTHFLLSHPLRAPLVSRLGAPGFLGLYSLIALVTFGAMIWAYGAAGRQQPLWSVGEAGWLIASLVMWLAAILLAGSFVGNPALPGAGRPAARPKGVFAITRHPMMWSFALWAIVHAALIATPKALILDAAILLLALAGSALQDRKKRAQLGKDWHDWTAQTAFWPFTRGIAFPGLLAIFAGTVLFLAATWAHPMPVAFWRLIG